MELGDHEWSFGVSKCKLFLTSPTSIVNQTVKIIG